MILVPLSFLRPYLIHFSVERFARNGFACLKPVAYTYIISVQVRKQLVIIPLSASQAVALPVERYARDDAQFDFVISGELFSRRFFDAESPHLQTVLSGVVAEFQQVSRHDGQEYLLGGMPLLHKGMRLHFIAQRMIA